MAPSRMKALQLSVRAVRRQTGLAQGVTRATSISAIPMHNGTAQNSPFGEQRSM
jgi:hypothetical protein